MDKKVIIKSYNSHLIALERRSPLTAETYRLEIGKFLDWHDAHCGASALVTSGVRAEGKLLFGKVTGLRDIIAYLEYRRTCDGINSRSAAKAISALRSFFRFMDSNGRLNPGGASDLSDLVRLLQSPRRADRLPDVHRKEDVDRLLSLLKTDTALGIRDRALYELLYSAGLRISEAVMLTTDALFLSKYLARVCGKGGKERLVIFGPDAAHWLRRYMEEARLQLLGRRTSKAVFISRAGRRLSRKGIWKNYCTLAMQAGLNSKLHTLRHTFATELLAGGADLRSVQELLGHSEIATTQIYTHIAENRLKDNHRKYLPKLKSRSGRP